MTTKKGDPHAAAEVYLKRQNRALHPLGRTDKGGRWLPDESERCACCDGIRTPSRSYPWSLMVHCRSLKHVAALYAVPLKDLRQAVKAVVATWRQERQREVEENIAHARTRARTRARAHVGGLP